MPVNQQDPPKIPSYKPSQEDRDTVNKLMTRIDELKTYRSSLNCNEYDVSPNARSIEEMWNYADYVSLPHKYWHAEMMSWMSDNSIPLILAKIDTAVSIIASKNPEVEISARNKRFEKKTKILEALYSLSWDKGQGRQQVIKFINNIAKYGFAVGREYHRFEKQTVQDIVGYDPEEGKHIVKDKEIIKHDEPYFEVLPIRDCWFDHRAKPYDEESMRDWCFLKTYDYSTFVKMFPVERFPEAKYVTPTNAQKDYKDKADHSDDLNAGAGQIKLWFYENIEDDEFIITDGTVLIYKEPLINHQLSCVTGMWKLRNEQIVYGIGLPEILENEQNMLDKLVNTTFNQVYLSIGGAGYYGGTSNVTESDLILEPKLKKLKDAERIIFPKIPSPDAATFNMIEFVLNSADEHSGVTKSLGGEQVGKTLGEAVLNREAGMRRLSTPLQNVEFALERHARLRVDMIQLIYSRPSVTKVIKDDFGNIIDEDLLNEYLEEKGKGSEIEFAQKFPTNEATGEMFRNEFKQERLSFEKTNEGEIEPSEQDNLMEVTPSMLGIEGDEIRGDYDVRIRAFSTIPMSKSLEESRALETFNIVAPLPDTDIYKAEKTLLKRRNEDPEEWMKSEEDVMMTQAMAAQGGMMGEEMPEGPQTEGAPTLVPPNELEQPASAGGLSSQLTPPM
jgi:hypothetical protein